jgi:hypothetical protein
MWPLAAQGYSHFHTLVIRDPLAAQEFTYAAAHESTPHSAQYHPAKRRMPAPQGHVLCKARTVDW